MRKIGTAVAFGLATSAMCFADGPKLNVAGDETKAAPNSAQVVAKGNEFPQACDNFLFDSGDSPTTNTGRTVGQPGADRWEVYEPITFGTDVSVCGIDLDGWYVTGTPDTFDVNIYPTLGNGDPDISNPLAGGPINLGGSGMVDWDSVDFDPVCLDANVQYYIGTDSGTNNNHWSAIYRDPALGGQPSFSIKNGDFSTRFNSSPIALRIRGDEGCGAGFELTVDPLVAGSRACWTVTGATPGEEVAIVYGFSQGQTVINGFAGYCATFGIQGVNAKKVICRKNADGNGNVQCCKSIPQGASGTFVCSQAAERNTCPDEKVSNLDCQTIQ